MSDIHAEIYNIFVFYWTYLLMMLINLHLQFKDIVKLIWEHNFSYISQKKWQKTHFILIYNLLSFSSCKTTFHVKLHDQVRANFNQ